MAGFTSLAHAGIVDYYRIGLVFSNDAIQPIFLPVRVRFVPIAVKPQAAYLAVIRAKQFN